MDEKWIAMLDSLIVGANSTIGRGLMDTLRDHGRDVLGTTRRPDGTGLPLDLANPPPLQSLPMARTVFICGALTGFQSCADNPDLAELVNGVTPGRIGRHYADCGARVIYLSTAAVFDGTLPKPSPESQISPRSAYGQSKAQGEVAICDLPGGAVLRLAKVIPPSGVSLFDRWIDDLYRGKAVDAFSDMYLAPIALSVVIETLITLADHDAEGIFHLSSHDEISYRNVAEFIAQRIRVPGSMVRSGLTQDAGLPDYSNPPHAALNCDRTTKVLGIPIPSAASAIATYKV
jgi:dTDP-4-dehydrorhamnose reductase